MNQSIFTARGGIIAQQKRLDIIGHNLANVNTNGFKAQRADFKDVLHQDLAVVQPAANGDISRGVGVDVALTKRSTVQGSFKDTGNSLDVGMNGDGYFAVQDSFGNLRYTRDGNFAVSIERNPDEVVTGEDGETETPPYRKFLVTSQGNYVLDTNGSKIELSGDVANMVIDNKGYITFPAKNVATPTDQTNITIEDTAAEDEVADVRMAIVDFENPAGLSSVGDNLFEETVMSGVAEQMENPFVQQGVLENSTVDLALEMTRMIRTQRALQLSSRALTTADEMDAKIAQLR